jgi:NAD(P)-dependent dehydrogenase (short-subunit alcohol dehydrogenase family)
VGVAGKGDPMGERLRGKRVFITGTGSGQGRGAALLFSRHGATIVGCDLDAEGARTTVEMVRADGGTMYSSAPLDLADGDAAKEWIEFGLDAVGGLDVLYNNASAPRFGAVGELSWDDWRFTMRNELDLIYWCCHHAWKPLKASGGGAILNTASIVGTVAGSGCLAHGAAKGGVISLTRQLAAEGAPFGIRANTVSPGTIDTPANDVRRADPQAWEALIGQHMLRRLGTVEDVAYCALYLCSDEASWVTGANFAVDGGRSAW